MDQDQGQDHQHYYSSNSPNGSEITTHSTTTTTTTENNNNNNNSSEPAVRSRWTPKPEQILILESIFNSGMVNPPKDETVRIRKLLEKFGAVGDANVFYWFQNRRSRSRRRQRQLQAQLNSIGGGGGSSSGGRGGGGAIRFESSSSTTTTTTATTAAAASTTAPTTTMVGFGSGGGSSGYSFLMGGVSGCSSSNSCGVLGDDHHGHNPHPHHLHLHHGLFPISGQMGFPEIEQSSAVTSGSYHPHSSNMHFQSSGGNMITVFINGVPTEVPKGPIDLKPMLYGQDVILVHSSGVAVPINDFGILLHSLQPGESYFLVPRSSLSNN